MNPGAFFTKTEAGRLEVAQRSDALNAMQRRLLIVIDGHKTLADLSGLVRPGELDAALAVLRAQGLVDLLGAPIPLTPAVAPGFAPSPPNQAPRPATHRPAFIVVRQQAADFVRERLGPQGEPICEAIDRCSSPVELRKLLRGIEIFVGQRLDAATTQAFARRFGALLL